jgi:Putative Ig domain
MAILFKCRRRDGSVPQEVCIMSPVFSGRRAAVAIVLAAIALLALAAGAAAAPNAPIWNPAVPLDGWHLETSPKTLFLGTSCTGAGDCVAAGSTQPPSGASPTEDIPVFAVERNGTWGPIVPVALSAEGGGHFQSVSCAGPTYCVAVGQQALGSGGSAEVSPLIAPISLSGGVGTAGPLVSLTLPGDALTHGAVLNGVSCPSVGNCTAVGSYLGAGGKGEAMIAVESGIGAWSASGPIAAPAAPANEVVLQSISCPSSGACEAVGHYQDSSANFHPWVVSATAGTAGPSEAVTPPSEFAPGPFESGLFGVSCPSAGVCTAGGSYSYSAGGVDLAPMVVPISDGTPATAVKLAIPSNGLPGEQESALVSAISCSDAVDCVTAANQAAPRLTPLVGSEIGGSWSSLEPLPLGSGAIGGALSTLSCTSAEDCLISGLQLRTNSSFEGEASTFFANSAGPLSTTTSSLPGATVGRPYQAVLQSSGGSGIESWSISVGSLPSGLSLDAATGIISGTPTTVGQNGFAATVSSLAPPQSATVSLSIAVSPAPPPAPAAGVAPVTPTVKIIGLKRAGAKLKVTLSCSATCSGALALTSAQRPKRNKRTATASGKKKTTITLATGRYSLAAAGTETVALVPGKAAAKLLKATRKVGGRLTATPAGSKLPTASKSFTF